MFDPFLALDFVALSLTILYLGRTDLSGSVERSKVLVSVDLQNEQPVRRVPVTTIGVGATISLPKRSLRMQGC